MKNRSKNDRHTSTVDRQPAIQAGHCFVSDDLDLVQIILVPVNVLTSLVAATVVPKSGSPTMQLTPFHTVPISLAELTEHFKTTISH